jgi:hypothetical protein
MYRRPPVVVDSLPRLTSVHGRRSSSPARFTLARARRGATGLGGGRARRGATLDAARRSTRRDARRGATLDAARRSRAAEISPRLSRRRLGVFG